MANGLSKYVVISLARKYKALGSVSHIRVTKFEVNDCNHFVVYVNSVIGKFCLTSCTTFYLTCVHFS